MRFYIRFISLKRCYSELFTILNHKRFVEFATYRHPSVIIINISLLVDAGSAHLFTNSPIGRLLSNRRSLIVTFRCAQRCTFARYKIVSLYFAIELRVCNGMCADRANPGWFFLEEEECEMRGISINIRTLHICTVYRYTLITLTIWIHGLRDNRWYESFDESRIVGGN